MATNTREIREHLGKRLKGKYSEAELDAIAQALEVDPDLPAPAGGGSITPLYGLYTDIVTPVSGWKGPDLTLQESTGTILSLESRRQFEPHGTGHEAQPDDFYAAIDFKMSPADLESMAQLMVAEDPQETLDRVFPPAPRPQKKRVERVYTYEEIRQVGRHIIVEAIRDMRTELEALGYTDIEIHQEERGQFRLAIIAEGDMP